MLKQVINNTLPAVRVVLQFFHIYFQLGEKRIKHFIDEFYLNNFLNSAEFLPRFSLHFYRQMKLCKTISNVNQHFPNGFVKACIK